MYRAGKQWLFAGIATLVAITTGNLTVHADITTQANTNNDTIQSNTVNSTRPYQNQQRQVEQWNQNPASKPTEKWKYESPSGPYYQQQTKQQETNTDNHQISSEIYSYSISAIDTHNNNRPVVSTTVSGTTGQQVPTNVKLPDGYQYNTKQTLPEQVTIGKTDEKMEVPVHKIENQAAKLTILFLDGTTTVGTQTVNGQLNQKVEFKVTPPTGYQLTDSSKVPNSFKLTKENQTLEFTVAKTALLSKPVPQPALVPKPVAKEQVKLSDLHFSNNVAQQAFIQSIAPGAISGWQKYHVLPSITAAQAILESGWGRSILTTNAHNLFGIKGSYNGQSVTMSTREVYNGKSVTVNANFRVYPSNAASLEDHGRFLNVNSRYHNLLGDTNYQSVANKLRQDGYATSPSYASSLISLIQTYNLVQLDNLALNGQADITSAQTDNNYYIVQTGDTLNKIASRFNTTAQSLANLNHIRNINLIYPGQNLLVKATQTANNVHQSLTSYVVKSGDTLNTIASQYNTTAQRLAVINHIANPNLIYPGQVINFDNNINTSADNITYTVKAGDTLSRIAGQFNTTYQKLAEINHIINPNLIYPGQVINIKAVNQQVNNAYTVQPGDSLSAIGARYHIDWHRIADKNHISAPYIIYIGRTIQL